jgi:4'-phosphopantetheinyl transferase
VTSVIEIVTMDLDQPDEVVAALAAELPDAERTGRTALRVARAATREIVGRAVGVAPHELSISRKCAHCGHATHGKPTLLDHRLTFSLSHSHRLGVLALSADGATVGVDVEELRPRRHLDRLAARAMTAAELGTWRGRPESERLTAFLDVWSRKEAYLKAVGLGLATDLRVTDTFRAGWSIDPLDVGVGYCAAVAVDRAAIELTFSAWTPRVIPSGGTAG